MRQRRQRGQSENSTAKLVGNLLMGAGVITPVVGIICTKFVTLDFDIYIRVLQAIFITGLGLFVSGILVKNYWTRGKTATRHDPFHMWSNANHTAQEQSFDWTGVGCSLLALGPGIFFIVGFLFAREFEYASVASFVCLALFLIVGSKLFRLGRARRTAQVAGENAASSLLAGASTFDYSSRTNAVGDASLANKNLPQIYPGRRPEGFVLVDNSGAAGCGVAFFGIFTAVWYGATFLFMFMVIKFGGENSGKGVLFLSLFLLAGLIPLSLLIRVLRMAGAFEKQAELLLPHWPLAKGEKVEMSFECRLKKDLTAMSIDVELEYEKVDRSSSETERTKLDSRTLSLRDFKQEGRLVTGFWPMNMPIEWGLPYKSGEKDINWGVKVVVELAEGPKGVFTFPLLVVPQREMEGDVADSEMTPRA
jgi:hypothetical protein